MTSSAIEKFKWLKKLIKKISKHELINADEIFLSGTAAEITPIKSIDEISYNVGENTISFELMNDFTNLVNSSL